MTKADIEQREAEILKAHRESWSYKPEQFQSWLAELNALMWAKVAIQLAENRNNPSLNLHDQ